MKQVNEVRISGVIAGEVKQSGNGPYRFQVKQRGGKKKGGETYWPDSYFSVVAWPNTIDKEIMDRVTRDKFIEVTGRLKPNVWVDKSGKRYGIDVLATTVTFPDTHPQPLTPDPARYLEITGGE